MDQLKLIACDPIVGLPRVPLEGIRPTVDDLLGEMHRLCLHAAIVRHRSCIDNAPYFGNRALLEDVAGRANLLPAWVLTPDGCEPDFDIRRTVREMLSAGVHIAWMYPKEHLYSVRPWCCGPLYAALQDARVPLLVEFDQLSADDIHEVCLAFPHLRLVLLNVPRLGRNRLIYRLLQQHPNLCLCLGPLLSVHEGFTDLVKHFGTERWVFGTGYPVAEGGAAVTGLLYAGLPAEATQKIAHENIERWLSEVAKDFEI
jgi:hypothetical protein